MIVRHRVRTRKGDEEPNIMARPNVVKMAVRRCERRRDDREIETPRRTKEIDHDRVRLVSKKERTRKIGVDGGGRLQRMKQGEEKRRKAMVDRERKDQIHQMKRRKGKRQRRKKGTEVIGEGDRIQRAKRGREGTRKKGAEMVDEESEDLCQKTKRGKRKK